MDFLEESLVFFRIRPQRGRNSYSIPAFSHFWYLLLLYLSLLYLSLLYLSVSMGSESLGGDLSRPRLRLRLRLLLRLVSRLLSLLLSCLSERDMTSFSSRLSRRLGGVRERERDRDLEISRRLRGGDRETEGEALRLRFFGGGDRLS